MEEGAMAGMKRRLRGWMWLLAAGGLVASGLAGAADTVPNEIQQPGTQPGETSQIQSVTKCDNCHGNFDPNGEPWFNWSGSMMAHASRDPIFWATMAVAEQDFDGAGDLCLRCHIPKGWLEGRSLPTDGSSMGANDANGVQCDLCHRLTNPDGSEHPGVQNSPYIANDEGTPDPIAYLGSGMYVVSNENAKLGPYVDADATHQFEQSLFHRSAEFCGTCHDVSNPAVGDLAPGNGAQQPLPPESFSGVPGAPVDTKAAFNAFPYQYGVVERTFSEYMSSVFPTLRVSDYATLPAELQSGAIEQAYLAAQLAGNGGDYEDGTTRYFTCQTCHMRPTVGQGCNKNPPVRHDLPVHDLTGGNYWGPEAIQYQDDQGLLLIGDGLSPEQSAALAVGAVRAQDNLANAASLSAQGLRVRVVNLTGHKLISGYPEGRRMWLRVRWYDAGDALVKEDGAYGDLTVDLDGTPTVVRTLLDLSGSDTRIYEVHPAMTQEWAAALVSLGWDPTTPLAYDRVTEATVTTLGDLANEAPGSSERTFHFVLNNKIESDTRIPPYGMGYDDAFARSALPVPASQYGDPGPGGTYDYFDELLLTPHPDAVRAEVELLYQPTSWEYIQFLHLANTGSVAHLADEGQNLLDTWLATGMAEPYVMAALDLDTLPPVCSNEFDDDGDGLVDADDPGCDDAADASEQSAALACDNGLDDDGDGAIDTADPGCHDPGWATESPACDNGVDDDQDGFVDWDGGGVGAPDPQCVDTPWRRSEAASSSCGLGGEVLPLLGLLAVARRRRGRRR
jgi:hypothetical protein